MKNIGTVLLVCSILGNLLLGFFLFGQSGNDAPGASLKSDSTYNADAFPLLSKRLGIEDPNDILINFIPLRTSLNEYIGQHPNELGVYFEYLPSGVSIGINDKEEFIQASLIKIPVAMAIYKSVERGLLRFDQQLVLKEEHLDSYFGDLYKRGVGGTVTVQEALEEMLQNSDNTAAYVLDANTPKGAREEVFDYLDIPLTTDGDNKRPTVTAKNYSSILRSLYLSAYLNEENSQKLLNLLTHTTFDEMIVGGVDPSVAVAHKYGVYSARDKDKIVFSDCGIIYYPKRPYILCVVAHSSQDEAKKYMREVSKIVYSYIDQVNDTH